MICRSETESLQAFVSVNGNQVCDWCTQLVLQYQAPEAGTTWAAKYYSSSQTRDVGLYKQRIGFQPQILAAAGSGTQIPRFWVYPWPQAAAANCATHTSIFRDIYTGERERRKDLLHLIQPSQDRSDLTKNLSRQEELNMLSLGLFEIDKLHVVISMYRVAY